MVAEIIVAVVCNLIALLILISGVFTAKSNGLRVTLIKFVGTLGALVGSYFLTPTISNALYGINGFELFVSNTIGASIGTINSCIFFVLFMAFYAFILMICSIVKHSLIKKMQNKKLNKIKIKRAKSINPKAERMVRKSEWKAARVKYSERRKWYHKLLSCLLGSIIAVSIGIITLMPFGYIGKDIDKASDKEYLVKSIFNSDVTFKISFNESSI